MKKKFVFPAKACLILAMLLVASALAMADISSAVDKEVQQHFEKANELLKRMDYEAAIDEYKKVVNMSSYGKVTRNAQYWIGQAHFRA